MPMWLLLWVFYAGFLMRSLIREDERRMVVLSKLRKFQDEHPYDEVEDGPEIARTLSQGPKFGIFFRWFMLGCLMTLVAWVTLPIGFLLADASPVFFGGFFWFMLVGPFGLKWLSDIRANRIWLALSMVACLLVTAVVMGLLSRIGTS